MKSIKKLVLAVGLVSIIAMTGCSAQKTQQSEAATNTKVVAQDKKEGSLQGQIQNMRNVIKDMKMQLDNKQDDKIAESGKKLGEIWKILEDKYEEDIKDKYIELYVKIEDPLGIIEAGSKVKPLDTKVIMKSLDELDAELTELQKRSSMYNGLEAMKLDLKDMSAQLNNKEEDKAIKTSDKLEISWKEFEDTIKEKNKDLYDKVELPLGNIQAAVKVKPLDLKILSNSIEQLDKTLDQVKKASKLISGPQNMKIALKKINKFMAPVDEQKAGKYATRLEKYWSEFEDSIKEKNPQLYKSIEEPLGVIEAGVKVKPIDTKTILAATEKLDKVLAEVAKIK